MYSRSAVPSTCLVAICSLWLVSCEKPKPQQNAVLTLKRDGSHFYGTVVRRDSNSITVSGSSGDIHTFLLTDLSGVSIVGADDKSTQPVTPVAESRSLTPLPAGGNQFEQPAGTQLAIRSNEFIDSCCTHLNDTELGILDADIKNSKGVVMIPTGANITFTVSDQTKADGRLSMTFELTTADYGGHHYVISSGAFMTVSGAKALTPEALTHGTTIHIDDKASMIFKASKPIVFKLST